MDCSCQNCGHVNHEPLLSSAFEWLYTRKMGAPEKEVFDTGTARFNIQRAKKIIHLAPRPVRFVDIAPYVVLLELLVDLEHKDEEGRDYNLRFPIIIATLKNGGKVPIDGWHRINQALKRGVAKLPAVFLTIEETKIVRRT